MAVLSGVGRRPRAAAAVAVIIALLVAGCTGQSSASEPAPTPSAAARNGTQVNDANNVTIKATWDGGVEPLTLDVAMDTHSVNLDGYDLTRLAVLRNERGDEIRPSAWDAPQGGHHREGHLTFAGLPAGFLQDTRYIELLVRDLAGAPQRTFRWTIGGGAGG